MRMSDYWAVPGFDRSCRGGRPEIALGISSGWVLLSTGESMRVWFDFYEPTAHHLTMGFALSGKPLTTVSHWIPKASIRGIEVDTGEVTPFPLDAPPDFEPLEGRWDVWRLNEATELGG
jgi:hypothetical protein